MPKKQFSFKKVTTEKNLAGYNQFSATNLADGFAESLDYAKLVNEGEFVLDEQNAKALVEEMTAYAKGQPCHPVGAFDQTKIEKAVNFCKKNKVAFADFVAAPERYFGEHIKAINERYDINKIAAGKSLGEKLYLMQVGPKAKKAAADVSACKDVAELRLGLAELGGDQKQIEENIAFAKLKNDLTVNNTIKYIQQPHLTSEFETTVHNMLVFKDKTVEEYCSSPDGKFDISTGKMASALNIQESLYDAMHVRKINYAVVTERANDLFQGYLKVALMRNQMDKAQQLVEAIKSFAQKDLPYTNYNSKDDFVTFAGSLTTNLTAKQVFTVLDGDDITNRHCSPMSKNIVLSMYGEKARQYPKLGWWTRFVSHIPGVKNEATKLRAEISEMRRELYTRGASLDEVAEAVSPDYKREVYHLDVNFEYEAREIEAAPDLEFTKQLEKTLQESAVEPQPEQISDVAPKTEVIKD